MSEETEIRKRSGRPILIAAAVLLVAVVVVVMLIVVQSGSPKRKLKEQLQLAERYLSELDYEQAVAAYRLALEIDPESVEAYLGLAEAYVGMGKYEDAVAALKEGYEHTQDENILKALADDHLAWAEEKNTAGDTEGAVDLLKGAMESLELLRSDANSELLDSLLEKLRHRLEELEKELLQNTGENGESDGTESEKTAELEQMTREIAELIDEEGNNAGLREILLGAVYRSYEEQREAYLPLIQELEDYISLYKEILGVEGETWKGYPAHNIGVRSNPPEEGYMSLPDAYDHLVFYYLQCGNMERAWELRSERIEYSGNPDLLNGYTWTLDDGSTNNYDAYGRNIGFANPDGYNQEYVFEIGNRPVEVFVNGESRFKYYYDEDGRCIRVERDHGEQITTYTYLEDGVLLEEWAYLDNTPRLKYCTIDKYGYLHAMEQADTE